MPVTIDLSRGGARRISTPGDVAVPEDLIRSLKPELHPGLTGNNVTCPLILTGKKILSSNNGFLKAALDAYDGGHHLSICPEEVYLTILSQIGFRLGSGPWSLQSTLDRNVIGSMQHRRRNPEEKRRAEALYGPSLHGNLSKECFDQAYSKFKNRALLSKILFPKFSNSKMQTPLVPATILTGAHAYSIPYKPGDSHGLVGITVEGERRDWEEIIRQLDAIDQSVSATCIQEFVYCLRSIIQKIIETFECTISVDTNDPNVRACHHFWMSMITKKPTEGPGGLGGMRLSGWLTYFMFFDEQGKKRRKDRGGDGVIVLGDKKGVIGGEMIPSAVGIVEVYMATEGASFKSHYIVAGVMGVECINLGDANDEDEVIDEDWVNVSVEGTPKNCLKPFSGWMMFPTP